MIYILTALMLEAAPLIRHFGLKKDLRRRDLPVFRHADILLAVSGIGKVQAAMAAAVLLSANPPTEQDLLLNIGFCGIKTQDVGSIRVQGAGSTHTQEDCSTPAQTIPAGTILSIWKVTDMDTGRDLYPDVFHGLDLPAATLECHPVVLTIPPDVRPVPSISLSAPIFSPEIVAIDMESAGIMAASRVWLAPHQVVLLKIVSDHLDLVSQAHTAANKARLEGLMTAQLEVIDQVIASWLALTASDPSANTIAQPADDTAMLELVSAKLRLTVAMRRMLAEDLRKARRHGLDPLPCLNAALTEEPRSKSAAKQCWLQLRKEILPDG